MYYELLKVNGLKEGTIVSVDIRKNMHDFILSDGVLREKNIYSKEQEQTKDTFSFKWEKKDTYSSNAVESLSKQWLLKRYCDNDIDYLHAIVPRGCKVLDAGCGAGYSASILFGDYINEIDYLGVDISEAVDVAKERFNERGLKGEFIQCDLNHIPFSEGTFDVIFSEGVLHHTDSTELAIRNLSRLLSPNGHLMFYVYNKKSVIREFTDDYIREYFKDKSNEEVWDELFSLTKLGKALGDLNTEINIDEDINCLGIKAGRMNLQRFFYWNIAKAFYKEDFTLEEMNHINFDWFRPLNCHRQTPEELENWCREAGLTIEKMDVEEAGITVIAKRKI